MSSQIFQLALLAKQGWQLQTNTHSLVSCVLKARYFPHTDFLQAELGSKPSFAWRSLIAAQCVVREGCRWQIGNGDSARIWHNKWLPQPSSFHPTTPPNTLPGDAWVSSLLDENIGEWRSDLVKQIFMQDDSDLILSMPRSHGQAVDRLVWSYTSRGTFTVRSAYKIVLSLSNHTHATRAFKDQSQHLFCHTL